PVGSGSCVSFSALPAMKAEAKVSRKRKMLKSGGRSAPSVPGPGGGGGRSVSSAPWTGSTRQPFPRFAQQIQPESAAAGKAAGKCTMRARLGAAAERAEGAGEVLVQIDGAHAARQRFLPALHGALELSALRQRDR